MQITFRPSLSSSLRWLVKLLGLLLLSLFLGVAATPALAQSIPATSTWSGPPLHTPSGPPTDVYFFHSITCPHCREQMPLMQAIAAHNPDVAMHIIEVSEHPDQWTAYLQEHQINTGAVPRTGISQVTFIGYSKEPGPLEYNPSYTGYTGYRNQIIAAIEAAVGHPLQLEAAQAQSPGQPQAQPPVKSQSPPWFLAAVPILYLGTWPACKRRLRTAQGRRYWMGGLAAVGLVSAFFFLSLTPDVAIKAFAENLPFPLFVSTIALADGFNPCAFTVLIILLSLLTYTRHRKHMALVGGTFILTSAGMYFLFILGMIGVGSVLLAKFGQLFLMALGGGVAIAGLINLKDYLWFKKGVTLSLSADQQSSITRRAGKIVRSLQSPRANRLKFLTALGGTVALAVFVNLVELGCTAILPAVYMTTLINYCDARSVAPWLCYGSWTALYALIYILPLLLILTNFIYSFHSTRLSETQGRRLKLVAGVFMLFFGLVMLLRPELLLLA